MGNGESSPLDGAEGFQVVRVLPNSPAHVAGLCPWFDFIVAVDNLPIDRDNTNFFFDYVRRSKDKPVVFRTLNLRLRAHRELLITPTDTWGGVGLLGCNVNWESATRAIESTWHIVDVKANSPAYRADLMANRDYLLGMQLPHDATAITLFRDSTDFHGRIDDWRAFRQAKPHVEPVLVLLVYDSVDVCVKEVDVTFAAKESSLGIDLANGYLHVVPNDAGSQKLPVVKRFFSAAAATPSPVRLPEGPGFAAQGQQQPVPVVAYPTMAHPDTNALPPAPVYQQQHHTAPPAAAAPVTAAPPAVAPLQTSPTAPPAPAAFGPAAPPVQPIVAPAPFPAAAAYPSAFPAPFPQTGYYPSAAAPGMPFPAAGGFPAPPVASSPFPAPPTPQRQ